MESSSSHLDVGAKAGKHAPELIRSDVPAFTSPMSARELMDQVTVGGGFLDHCYYCKKRILEDTEIYMYRYDLR